MKKNLTIGFQVQIESNSEESDPLDLQTKLESIEAFDANVKNFYRDTKSLIFQMLSGGNDMLDDYKIKFTSRIQQVDPHGPIPPFPQNENI